MRSSKSLMMMNKLSLFMLVATLIWIGGTNYDDHVMAAADSTMDGEAAAAESNIWCVANYSTSDQALNDIIQYVCGQSQMDCSPIKPGGSCYEPNILYRHASFVMNRYYQVNRQPHECDFSGHAVNITWDPSCGSCYYDRKYK